MLLSRSHSLRTSVLHQGRSQEDKGGTQLSTPGSHSQTWFSAKQLRMMWVCNLIVVKKPITRIGIVRSLRESSRVHVFEGKKQRLVYENSDWVYWNITEHLLCAKNWVRGKGLISDQNRKYLYSREHTGSKQNNVWKMQIISDISIKYKQLRKKE